MMNYLYKLSKLHYVLWNVSSIWTTDFTVDFTIWKMGMNCWVEHNLNG